MKAGASLSASATHRDNVNSIDAPAHATTSEVMPKGPDPTDRGELVILRD